MADTVEEVATRLFKFFEEAKKNASPRFPAGVKVAPTSGKANERPILTTYKKCLSKLTPSERSALARMIQTMSEGLRDPREGTPRP